jgi:flagellar hook assembly protein FlgD
VIRYDVPADGGRVSLRIYDVTGELMRTLVDGTVTPGQKSARWDGTDARGNSVSSGVYFYRLRAGSKTLTRKMVFLK